MVNVSLKQFYSHIVILTFKYSHEEESDPSYGHHDPHLSRAQLVQDPVDVDQLHVGRWCSAMWQWSQKTRLRLEAVCFGKEPIIHFVILPVCSSSDSYKS